MDIKQNIKAVKEKISKSAEMSGRSAGEICLVAVSKKVNTHRIVEAFKNGIRVFGESYAQEVRDKFKIVEDRIGEKPAWHFIGKLQRNKVKYLVGKIDLIHSLDNLSAADEINKRALELGVDTSVLIEINSGGELSKGGIDFNESEEFIDQLSELKSIRIKGLMTMPPYFDDTERSRMYFRDLRNLRDNLRMKYPNIEELSMGMSDDFEVAIEEGATIVRIGTSIFGPREN